MKIDLTTAGDKSALSAWYDKHVVKGFFKAESWIVNAGAVLIGIVPDLINLLLSNWSMVDSLPTLNAEHKLYLFAVANVLATILRARKQKNMPQETVPVAVVNVPDTVDVATGLTTSVPVATEIHEVAAREVVEATKSHL